MTLLQDFADRRVALQDLRELSNETSWIEGDANSANAIRAEPHCSEAGALRAEARDKSE